MNASVNVVAGSLDSYPRAESMSVASKSQEAERWLEAHGDRLYRHALLRVRDHAAAQDLVQETLLAAWRTRAKQPEVESESAWLMGILRNKVADYFRHRARNESAWDPETLLAVENAQFSAGGWCGRHWLKETGPRGWWATSAAIQENEFLSVLKGCVEKLPDQAAQVFLLREMDERTTQDICSVLSLTSSNVFVLLHRARLALRRCLEFRWFERKGGSKKGN